MATIKKMTACCDSCKYRQEIEEMTQETVGMKCPKCGAVMITQKDFLIYKGLMEVLAIASKLAPNATEVVEAQIKIGGHK